MERLSRAAKALAGYKRIELLSASRAELPRLRNELQLLEKTHELKMRSLTEGLSAMHITALPVAELNADSDEIQRIAQLMRTPVLMTYDWMCWPVYRDALAFYNVENQLVGVLNICFGCDRMLTHAGEEITADTSTYQALRALLSDLGHIISEP